MKDFRYTDILSLTFFPPKYCLLISIFPVQSLNDQRQKIGM